MNLPQDDPTRDRIALLRVDLQAAPERSFGSRSIAGIEANASDMLQRRRRQADAIAIDIPQPVSHVLPLLDRLATQTEMFQRETTVDVSWQKVRREPDCLGIGSHGHCRQPRASQKRTVIEAGRIPQRIGRMVLLPQFIEFQASLASPLLVSASAALISSINPKFGLLGLRQSKALAR